MRPAPQNVDAPQPAASQSSLFPPAGAEAAKGPPCQSPGDGYRTIKVSEDPITVYVKEKTIYKQESPLQ